MTPLVVNPPVAGGLDLDLPGDDVRLRATRWRGAGTPVLLLHGLADAVDVTDARFCFAAAIRPGSAS